MTMRKRIPNACFRYGQCWPQWLLWAGRSDAAELCNSFSCLPLMHAAVVVLSFLSSTYLQQPSVQPQTMMYPCQFSPCINTVLSIIIFLLLWLQLNFQYFSFNLVLVSNFPGIICMPFATITLCHSIKHTHARSRMHTRTHIE